MTKLKRYVTKIGRDEKVIPEAKMIDLYWKKEILSTDSSYILAWKIFNHFNIGELVKVYGVEPVHFKRLSHPIPLPDGICCSIVGRQSGYTVVYPKGYLVVRKLLEENVADKQFMSEINTDQSGKNYYSIWRTK